MVDLCLTTEQFPLAGLVGEVAAHLVAVFFCLQHGDQVDAGPHLFAGEFAVVEPSNVSRELFVVFISSLSFRS